MKARPTVASAQTKLATTKVFIWRTALQKAHLPCVYILCSETSNIGSIKLTIIHCSTDISIANLHNCIPLHHQLQLRLGVLDLVLGLHIQHVGRVFPIDL